MFCFFFWFFDVGIIVGWLDIVCGGGNGGDVVLSIVLFMLFVWYC